MTIKAQFDPIDQQDPVRALTLAIRRLRIGESVRMADGTMVKSTTSPRGGSGERRFAVVPAEEKSTAVDRHKASVLGHSSYRTAEEAARKVLNEQE